jgi:flagellar biosynthetic protein FlhB
MAEESDLEKTEPASPRRLEEARDKGQVPRSPELATFAVLMSAGGALFVTGGGVVHRLSTMVENGLTVDRTTAYDTDRMLARLVDAAWAALLALSPMLLVVLIVAIAAPLLLSGWLFTFEAVAPQFSRLNPVSGFGRIFSTRGAIELGKAIAKATVVGVVATLMVLNELDPILGLATEAPEPAMAHLGRLLGVTFLTVAGALALIVAIDVPFQLWDHARQLRMTRQEVRQETKESEGDPQIKGRIRQLQREAARRRMMAAVPKADVVVTNPTHYAVAVEYREGRMKAPRVVAKGQGLIAERIREIAREARVPLLEAPPLARALHAHAEVGDEIPAALYQAVATVLAHVYQLRLVDSNGAPPPSALGDLGVPPELDPAIDAAAA